MKLAVVGGGSTHTPELVAGLARERERLDLREVVLQDIDPERREIVGGLAGRMLDAGGYQGTLAVTDDLDAAVDGASFVLIQLRVGGQTARLSDETVPLACGCIGQETTGAGGLGKALRTVPVVLNHLTWVRAVRVDGKDLLPELLADRGDELAESAGLPRNVLERLGAIPSYYLHYFYLHDEVLERQRTEKPRAAEVAEIERELLELYRDPSLTTKPKLLEQRGGAYYSDAATQLVTSLATGNGDIQALDVRNT